jgi:glucose 1-dehydrogenase
LSVADIEVDALHPRGIRTNVVHPGMIETPATAAAYVDSESRRARERAIPMGRIGTPEDIAGAVVFLASDLSAYVNGAELTVDGGFGRNLIGLVPRLPN